MVVSGRFTLLGVLAAIGVAVLLPSWLGVVLATGLLSALALADVVLAPKPAALKVTRAKTTPVRLGGSTTATITVVNPTSRAARGFLWDDWPRSAQPTGRANKIVIPPEGEVTVSTTLTPLHRGDRIAGPVTVRLLGPLGLAGRQARHQLDARVRALPAFQTEKLLASRVRLLQHLEGTNVARIRGPGTEFDSFREYAPGDDVRTIDWRATARANDVMVRTWRPERNRHVLMILDTGRVHAGRVGGTTRLDAAMEAALLLGGLAAAGGDTVGLMAFDREVRADVRSTGGKRLQLTLMHAMATLTATLDDTDCTGLVRAALARTRRRGLVVLFTNLDRVYTEENLLPALPVLARRHHLIVVSATDADLTHPEKLTLGGDVAPTYATAAAEETRYGRDLAAESLRRNGITVITAEPADLPSDLADEYLELKRAGTL